MIDRNKLNRVKGILSAKHGAEVPKYEGGAKFLARRNNNMLFSNNQENWFFDQNLTQPYKGSVDGYDISMIGNSTSLNNPSSGMQFTSQDEIDEVVEKNKKNVEIAGAITNTFQTVGNAFGAKQSMTDSNLTKGIDVAYNMAADMASQFGPVGQFVGTAMKTASTAGNILQGLGGGTDQMTTTDKWMDSPVFSWWLGAANGFGGKKSENFGVDQNIMAQVGSSYGGAASELNDAANKAGKKYGLFSAKARRRANAAIADARKTQSAMGNIADSANDQRMFVQSMGEQAGLNYSLMMDGGYNQKYTYAAKQGGILEWNPTIELEWQPQVKLNWELPKFKEGGNIDIVEELEWIPEFKSGNKIRTIVELIEYAKKKNPRFIQRLSEEPRGIKFIDDEGNDSEGSHYLESRGEYVIPRIQEIDGELKFLSPQEAIDRAMKTGNYLEMSPEEAIVFAEQYKQGWPEFFKKFKKGGNIELIRELEWIPEMQNGGKVDLSKVLDYYNGHDLKGVNFIKDSQARAEGNNIYYSNEEDAVHELWHYISKNNPNKMYEDFYKNLNDDVITSLGGDLQFVKRIDGDPGHFYHPSELEARIKAAKFMTPGEKYTIQFFKNLRSNENKYGYNMRDLLHMYNDENLEKIFNLKKGGSLGKSDIPEIEETTQKNVIPEGALHKNKHHMEHAEGLTKKGIPVIDEEGEQQAEIEHSEIIFTLEVTKKLEEYYEIFYSDEATNKEKEQAAIDVGKLLVYQILENTEDRTGLIESCKKGGSLTLKKSTDDLIEEVLDWMPTIIVVEEEEKPKKKSEKDQMKEAIKEVLIELLVK